MEKRLAKLERRDKEARLILIRAYLVPALVRAASLTRAHLHAGQRVQAAQATGEGQVPGQLTAQEAELAASTLGAGIAGPGELERGAGSDADSDEE